LSVDDFHYLFIFPSEPSKNIKEEYFSRQPEEKEWKLGDNDDENNGCKHRCAQSEDGQVEQEVVYGFQSLREVHRLDGTYFFLHLRSISVTPSVSLLRQKGPAHFGQDTFGYAEQ
jgi:hypothetical protein